MHSNNWNLFPKPPPCLGGKGGKFTATNIDESLARHNYSRARIRMQVKIKDDAVTAPAQEADSTDDLINREFQSQTTDLGDNTILCHGHLLIHFIVVISYQRGFVNSYPDSGKLRRGKNKNKNLTLTKETQFLYSTVEHCVQNCTFK